MRRSKDIFKRKDGRYVSRYIKGYYLHGIKNYGYIYSKSYTECKERLDFYNSNSKNIIKSTDLNKTLNHLVFKWLISKTNIKESSYTRYYNLIYQHILNDIGRTRLVKLNSEIVNNYLLRMLEKRKIRQ